MAYYCSPSDMIRYFGAIEMAQRSANEAQPLVPPACFVATVNNQDRSAWTQAENDNADDALIRMNQIIVDASGYCQSIIASAIDSLESEYIPEVLRRTTADIARYMLYDDGWPDDVKVNYDNAKAWLRMVNNGEAQLGDQLSGSSSIRQWTLARS